jgi:hypothetical protein
MILSLTGSANILNDPQLENTFLTALEQMADHSKDDRIGYWRKGRDYVLTKRTVKKSLYRRWKKSKSAFM